MALRISFKEAVRRIRDARTLADIRSLFQDAFGLTEAQLYGSNYIPDLPNVKAPLDLTQAAKLANPDYNKVEGYDTNCQRCAFAFELLRRGKMIKAAPDPRVKGAGTSKRLFMNGSEGFKNVKIHGYHYDKQSPISRTELIRELNLLPNGARASIFWIYPGAKNGHVIVMEKQDGNLIFIDPQSGTIGIHTLGEATRENGYYWYRMDNLEIDENFEWTDIVEPNND